MSQYGMTVLLGNFAVGVPALILIVISLIGVPFVTRWALRSFSDLKERLDRIDLNTRGALVEERGLPTEVLRLVRDINSVLRRLDSGFESTERFFVNAAHELRTPIAILQVRIDTLPASEDKMHLQMGIKRLTAITNQLLDTEKYRQKPQQYSPVDLNAIVSKVVADIAPFAIAEGYEIAFDSDTKDAFVCGDAEALERAFINLVRNAIQYGGGRGQISIGIEADGSVTVADQGCGIADDKHARIFEPFYRVSPHGSGAGLGLSMVNEIVTRHGGYVELSSAPGKGSTFAVRWRDM
jgi:signal transduction histidine kinase